MRPYFQTPGTALTWATLDEWLDCARKIDRRRASALRNRQAELHVRALPVSVIHQCASRATLVSCDRLLRRGPTHFCRPPRGRRQTAPQTAPIVAIANRIDQIDREDRASISPWAQQPKRAGPMTASPARFPEGRRPPSPTPGNSPSRGIREKEGREGIL